MRVVVIGAAGQLGHDLIEPLQMAGNKVIGLSHSQIELTDSANLDAVLRPIVPDFVINCAAYNMVDRAEDEPERAFQINALGPRLLARHCEAQGWRLVHFSSDYVFGGIPFERARTGEPLTESERSAPNSAYAVSKLGGESFVLVECSRSFVVRTCGLYGIAARSGAGKGNFVETMLKLGRDRSELRVVDDQCCTPTSTADLAQAVVRLVQTEAFGLYHITNSGRMTWCEFAREIFRLANLPVTVTPITTAEFGAKARRPAFSVLNCLKFETATNSHMPDWHDALSRYLSKRDAS